MGAQLYISQEAIDAGQVDVINGSMSEAGIAIALREDTEVFNELLGKQPDPTASGGIWTWSYETDNFTGDGTTTDYTLSYNPVIHIDSITNGGTPTTAYTCDFYDGKISFTAAPVSGNAVVVNYWYSDRGVYFDANTTGSFKYEDRARARQYHGI